MGRKIIGMILLVVWMTVSGCSALIIRDTDTPGEEAGKVLGRIVLGIGTIGMSELIIGDMELKEERQAWWDQATYEERAEYQAYQREMVLRLAPILLQNMQPKAYQPPPVYKPVPFVLPPQPPIQPPINCTSYQVGDRVYTDCY